jgi:NAD(P)-dependent dehydrogenase (short-subunit alcohol dehydrogenase family)
VDLQSLFRVDNQIAIVTGGGGVLPGAMAKGLAQAGAKVVLLGRTMSKLEAVAAEISKAGGEALCLTADVLNRAELEAVRSQVIERYGQIDILVNGAGGNHPAAVTSDQLSFFDMTDEAVRYALDLNYLGTLLPCQVFGKVMADQKAGVIINISSMAAMKPLTRVAIYAGAKAGISNLTEWLAVHMAQNYSTNIRVNAVAPGFYLGDQNRRMLVNDDGSYTLRGQTIVDHTPMKRFGEPDELVGVTLWLASPASQFVTGIIVPIDGGFAAFGGI